MSDIEVLIQTTRRLLALVVTFILCLICSVVFYIGMLLGWFNLDDRKGNSIQARALAREVRWRAPDVSTIPMGVEGDLIRYGRDLIEHTSVYLGPNGSVSRMSNGLNCQNCHLAGGTKPFAGNFSTVASTYPKFRNRSGVIEGYEKRVNECFQRSMNGGILRKESREMKAMIAYIKWVGHETKAGDDVWGAGLVSLPFLKRSANPGLGKESYKRHCATCHGNNGEGKMAASNLEWTYPPLWGPNSYNNTAGLFRISKFAAFIKANMPYGTMYKNPVLTDEEAWDIAAYVNTMPRPEKNFPGDWPDLSKKPVDHPYGPYTDDFSENDHKYGPYEPIISRRMN